MGDPTFQQFLTTLVNQLNAQTTTTTTSITTPIETLLLQTVKTIKPLSSRSAYKEWKVAVLRQLEAHDIDKYVLSDIKIPDEGQPNRQSIRRERVAVLTFLEATITPQLQQDLQLMGYKPESASPFDLWTLCKNRYGSEAHDKHTISLLSKEWLTLSMEKVGGSRSLLMKVTSLAAELERVGQTMNEIMIVERTLQAWNARYSNDEVILRDFHIAACAQNAKRSIGDR